MTTDRRTPIERMVDEATGYKPPTQAEQRLERQRQKALADAYTALVEWRQKPMNGQQGLCDVADRLIELGW